MILKLILEILKYFFFLETSHTQPSFFPIGGILHFRTPNSEKIIGNFRTSTIHTKVIFSSLLSSPLQTRYTGFQNVGFNCAFFFFFVLWITLFNYLKNGVLS